MRIKIGDLTPALLQAHPVWVWDETAVSESEDYIRAVDPSVSGVSVFPSLMLSASVTLPTADIVPGIAVYDSARKMVLARTGTGPIIDSARSPRPPARLRSRGRNTRRGPILDLVHGQLHAVGRGSTIRSSWFAAECSKA